MAESNFYTGVVESRYDPLKLGRVQVRVVGLHTPDRDTLPTEDLPWAAVIQNGSGFTPIESDTVIVQFTDYPDNQMPVVMGVIPRIPQSQNIYIQQDEETPRWIDPLTPRGRTIPTNGAESDGDLSDTLVTGENSQTLAALLDESVTTQTEPSSVETLLTNTSTLSTGTNAISALESSVGGQTRTPSEKYHKDIIELGQESASVNALSTLCRTINSNTPAAIYSQILSSSQLLSELNDTVHSLILRYGSVKTHDLLNAFDTLTSTDTNSIVSTVQSVIGADDRLTNLASEALTRTVFEVNANQSLVNKFGENSLTALGVSPSVSKTVFGASNLDLTNVSGLATSLTSEVAQNTVSEILQNANSISRVLGYGTISEYAELAENTFSNLTSAVDEVSNLTQYQFTDTSLTEIYANIFSSLSGILLKNSTLTDLVSLVSSNLPNLSPFTDMIGRGLTSQRLLDIGVGGISTMYATAKNDGSLKNVTSDTFFKNGVGRGATPPTEGVIGGANFGGGAEKYETPEKQDTEKYPSGVSREVDVSALGASNSVQTIKSVAESVGLKTSESLATYLAVVDTLTNQTNTPSDEPTNYTVTELRTYFPISFGQKSESLVNEYALGRKSPTEFYNYVYDVSTDGRTYGNTLPTDSEKFRGHGLIRICGRREYQKYADALGDPLLLERGASYDNLEVWAKISALKFLECTNDICPTAHPQFFYSACKVFGLDPSRLESKYETLYGAGTQTSNGVGEKIAGNTPSVSPLYSYGVSANSEYGFTDPNKKYPSKDTIGKPTLSRLSRGDITNSIVTKKEQNRRFGVKLPNGIGSWNQPHSSYGAQYPYNDVRETESGHVIEIDDTPGHERLHFYHRTGTFTEVDPSGVKVTRIVGDSYSIVDRNGFISIEGAANVTVGGNINVYCRNNANIEVEGSTELKIGGALTAQVASNLNLNVGGDFNLWANGNMNIQTAHNAHILSKENTYLTSYADTHVTSLGNTYTLTEGNTHHTTKGSMSDTVKGNVNTLIGANLYTTVNQSANLGYGKKYETVNGSSDLTVFGKTTETYTTDLTQHIGARHSLDVGGSSEYSHLGGRSTTTVGTDSVTVAGDQAYSVSSTYNITSGANIVMNGAQIHLNSFAGLPAIPTKNDPFLPIPATMANSATPSTEALIHGMVSPLSGTPTDISIAPFDIPSPIGGGEFMIELPEDSTSPLAQIAQAQISRESGKTNTIVGIPSTVNMPQNTEKYIAQIDDTNFYAGYKLSEHFVLSDLFDGGFNNRHRLREQCDLTKTEIVANLTELAQNVLEKLLENNILPNGMMGKNRLWRITSGYRMGNSKSQHNRGQAVDIQLTGRVKAEHLDLAQKIARTIEVDQIILETRGNSSVWVHISYNKDNLRHQQFTIVNDRKIGDGFILTC